MRVASSMLHDRPMTGVPVRSLSAEPHNVGRTDELIVALDQQSVGEGTRRWVVHVLGLHTDGRTRWIQVAPSDQGDDSIVLQLPPEATADDALTALGTVAFTGGEYPRIIHVSHRT